MLAHICSRRSVAALIAGVVLSFAWIGLNAPRAHATLRCSSYGYACGWVNTYWGSSRGNWAGNNPHLSDFTESNCSKNGNWNDCISSLWNNGTSCNITWFWDASYGTPGLLNHMDNGDPDLTDNSPNWNDQISSDEWCLA